MEWTQKHEAVLRERLVAHAVVVDSSFLRGVVTAVLWMMSPPCPMKVFDDRLEAERWLFSMIEERG